MLKIKYFRFEINKDTILFKTENKYLSFFKIFLEVNLKFVAQYILYEINIRNYSYCQRNH